MNINNSTFREYNQILCAVICYCTFHYKLSLLFLFLSFCNNELVIAFLKGLFSNEKKY